MENKKYVCYLYVKECMQPIRILSLTDDQIKFWESKGFRVEKRKIYDKGLKK